MQIFGMGHWGAGRMAVIVNATNLLGVAVACRRRRKYQTPVLIAVIMRLANWLSSVQAAGGRIARPGVVVYHPWCHLAINAGHILTGPAYRLNMPKQAVWRYGQSGY
jgi:hypothetical protein